MLILNRAKSESLKLFKWRDAWQEGCDALVYSEGSVALTLFTSIQLMIQHLRTACLIYRESSWKHRIISCPHVKQQYWTSLSNHQYIFICRKLV